MKPATPYQSVFAPGLLQGQVILVTGGGSGIGRCTAHELASLGAHVVLVGRNSDKLSAAAQEIVGDGGQASWHSCDIRREGDVQAMVAQVGQWVQWVLWGQLEELAVLAALVVLAELVLLAQ